MIISGSVTLTNLLPLNATYDDLHTKISFIVAGDFSCDMSQLDTTYTACQAMQCEEMLTILMRIPEYHYRHMLHLFPELASGNVVSY